MECEKCNDRGVIYWDLQTRTCDCFFGLSYEKSLEESEKFKGKLKQMNVEVKKIDSIKLNLNDVEELIELSLAIKNEELFMHYTNMKMEMMK